MGFAVQENFTPRSPGWCLGPWAKMAPILSHAFDDGYITTVRPTTWFASLRLLHWFRSCMYVGWRLHTNVMYVGWMLHTIRGVRGILLPLWSLNIKALQIFLVKHVRIRMWWDWLRMRGRECGRESALVIVRCRRRRSPSFPPCIHRSIWKKSIQ